MLLFFPIPPAYSQANQTEKHEKSNSMIKSAFAFCFKKLILQGPYVPFFMWEATMYTPFMCPLKKGL